MKKLTEQELFDQACEGMSKQNWQGSYVFTCDGEISHCKYRGPNGVKCVVGQLIKDRCYTDKMEGGSVRDLLVQDALKYSGIFTDDETINFLDKLQVCHDDNYKEENLKNSFKEFARNNSLEWKFE